MPNPRTGRPRERAKAEVRATQRDCWLCGEYVDTTLDAQSHPLGSTIDEIVPISQGGSATDPANLLHAHRACNTYRGDRDVTPDLRASLLAYLVRTGLRTPTHGTPSRSW